MHIKVFGECFSEIWRYVNVPLFFEYCAASVWLQNECDIGIQKHACLDVVCIMQYKGLIIISDIRISYLL